MLRHFALSVLSCAVLASCQPESSGITQSKEPATPETASLSVKISGAMRNVMRKGELGGVIRLDTIADRKGLFGIGPVSYLRGELLINDGKSYRSVVTSDSTMRVDATFDVEAPFFVYGNATDWEVTDLPRDVKSAGSLEKYINDRAQETDLPFIFKLTGRVESAVIHVQNLPEGSTVSSPAEAHQGQVNYQIIDRDVEIVGFYSRNHQGVFTHHDSFVHLHLITADEAMMGHLDEVVLGEMKLMVAKQ